jgi:hypothetical protein
MPRSLARTRSFRPRPSLPVGADTHPEIRFPTVVRASPRRSRRSAPAPSRKSLRPRRTRKFPSSAQRHAQPGRDPASSRMTVQTFKPLLVMLTSSSQTLKVIARRRFASAMVSGGTATSASGSSTGALSGKGTSSSVWIGLRLSKGGVIETRSSTHVINRVGGFFLVKGNPDSAPDLHTMASRARASYSRSKRSRISSA